MSAAVLVVAGGPIVAATALKPVNKAWIIGSEFLDYNAIVYAPTRNAARMRRADGFEDCEYIEITAHRLKAADQWANEHPGVRVEYNQRRMYELGWWTDEGSTPCEACDKYPFYEVDDSAVCPNCYHCKLCGCEEGCEGWNDGE